MTNKKDDKDNNKIVIKAKGVISDALCLEHFEALYGGISIQTQRKNRIINYVEGYVDISQTKLVNLYSDSYKKISKVSKDGVWADTKPLLYSELSLKGNTKDKPNTAPGVKIGCGGGGGGVDVGHANQENNT